MKEKAVVGASFAVGNVLATFPAPGARQKALPRDDPEVELNTTSTVTSALSKPCGITQITWETTLYQPVFRKLVNESSRIFISLQKTATNEENERKCIFLGYDTMTIFRSGPSRVRFKISTFCMI